jgi:NTP pyrophosphatase (non-canonical NTP hydrolase)
VNKAKTQSLYKQALRKWGCSTQVMMAMGECGELIAALNRFTNQSRGTVEEVVTEIADVEVMMGQLRMIFGAERVEKEKQRKLKRLDATLKEPE